VRTSYPPEVIRLVVMMYVRFPLSHAAKELDKALIVNPHGIVANIGWPWLNAKR
jgi:hypothetical protein